MIIVKNASGRARCSICKEIIEKGIDNQVTAKSYKYDESCHLSCIVNYSQFRVIWALQSGGENQ
jgi:hypothetical protein